MECVSEKVETIILEACRCNSDARRTMRVQDTLCWHTRDLKRHRGFIASLVMWNREMYMKRCCPNKGQINTEDSKLG